MWLKGFVAAALCLSMAAAEAQDKRYYRYLDSHGQKVIDDNIPPELVANGYEILNALGQVIKVVPRALTEEELRNKSTELARQILAEREAEKQREWDESLLRRYSSISDIEAARKRRIQDLTVRLTILKSNLLAIKSQIETEQSKAANIERRGGTVPESYREKLNILTMEIADTEQLIASRQKEISRAEGEYQREIERFTQLLENKKTRGHYLFEANAKGEEEKLVECLMDNSCDD